MVHQTWTAIGPYHVDADAHAHTYPNLYACPYTCSNTNPDSQTHPYTHPNPVANVTRKDLGTGHSVHAGAYQ